ncbi:DNA-directed RNA polymerase III subunit RPC9 [Eurytemora carolleeae]|uniref:DNA-directed RNA polymerase III subunit RPC9 n=1 Tax=Eurytemora carolleeae TaxID=1294199 RepID=UPI000C78AB64|nr:DNA-directed RNA polymerase III subunit RPC9 [Eurytemora carolleeae]|eukprot:XP_023334912.1 DNA-directed RNA polymerase III subunit RPC9-like [Eurytemora affinis]
MCVQSLQDLCVQENILFSKEEFIQLTNLRPKTAVEIQLLIDNSEERLTEDQVEKILEIISTTLPGLEEEEEEEGAAEGEGEQEPEEES